MNRHRVPSVGLHAMRVIPFCVSVLLLSSAFSRALLAVREEVRG